MATRIDHKLEPLSTPLENGQTVEIITANGARPNPSWLNFVETGKAKSNIRHFLKTQKDSDIISLGKKLLNVALNSYELSINQVPDEVFNKLLKEYKLLHIDELFKDTGIGNRLPYVVADRLARLLKVDAQKITDDSHAGNPIYIKGTEGTAVTFAECCWPIPGDSIVGVFAGKQGMVIHQDKCEKLAAYKNYSNAQQNIHVLWEANIKSLFDVKIIVEVINERGMLAELAIAISESKANIEQVMTKDKDGGFYTLIIMQIEVRDRNHLAQVIRNLRKIKNVNNVYRSLEK